MKRREKSRTKKVTIYLTPEEHARLLENFHSSTHRKFAVYMRDLVHRQPVVVRYRNQSLDELLVILNKIKNELEVAGRNFNQAVQKLNSLSNQGQLKDTLEYFAAEQFALREKSAEIKNLLVKIHQQWSQK
jgi:hypothetical protein